MAFLVKCHKITMLSSLGIWPAGQKLAIGRLGTASRNRLGTVPANALQLRFLAFRPETAGIHLINDSNRCPRGHLQGCFWGNSPITYCSAHWIWPGYPECNRPSRDGLQAISGEMAKYLLLCSKDCCLLRVIYLSNRCPRGHLQDRFWGNGPVPIALLEGFGPCLPLLQSASRDASSRFLGESAITYCSAHWIRPSLRINNSNRTSRDVLQGRSWENGPVPIALSIGSDR